MNVLLLSAVCQLWQDGYEGNWQWRQTVSGLFSSL